MFNLTRQERGVLLFICLVLSVGLLINLFYKRISPRIPRQVIFAKSQQKYKKVNINTATVEQLMDLPGIGPALAGRIIEYRSLYGAFLFPEDLQKVKGIGAGKYEKIKDFIVID